jgi:2'-5' RNA ligase
MPERTVPADGKPARVFLALWPDEPVRQRLAEETRRLHMRLGGRMCRAETVHLTLVFVGDIGRERLPALLEALADIKLPSFALEFDAADCWRHNRIAFLTASEPPPPLFELVRALEACLDRLAIHFDRRPYKPHVTLLRKAECKSPTEGLALHPMLGSAIHWPVDAFLLVESALTSVTAEYRTLARFPLASGSS